MQLLKVIISVLKIIFKAALTIEQDTFTFSYFTIFNIKTIKQLNLKKNLLKLIVLESINSLESISLLFDEMKSASTRRIKLPFSAHLHRQHHCVSRKSCVPQPIVGQMHLIVSNVQLHLPIRNLSET